MPKWFCGSEPWVAIECLDEVPSMIWISVLLFATQGSLLRGLGHPSISIDVTDGQVKVNARQRQCFAGTVDPAFPMGFAGVKFDMLYAGMD